MTELSPFPRLILGGFCVMSGLVMAIIAPPTHEDGYFSFSLFCWLIALMCIVKGRVRQCVGSFIGCFVFILAIWYLYESIPSRSLSGDGERGGPILGPLLFLWFIGRPSILYVLDVKFGFAERKDVNQPSWKKRLMNPDWDTLVQHFDCSISDAVISLYRKDIINEENVTLAQSLDLPEDMQWHIAFFQPADTESIIENEEDGMESFAFANDGFGNLYYIDFRIEDPSVSFIDHESGECKYVCDSLSEFITWPIVPSEGE